MLFTMILGNQVAVSRNNQIDTLSSWGKHFVVEADITVNSFNGPGWKNIIHFTTGKYLCYRLELKQDRQKPFLLYRWKCP